jgi:hypothetical protein
VSVDQIPICGLRRSNPAMYTEDRSTRSEQIKRASRPDRTPPARQAEWPAFRPAQVAQYSHGAHTRGHAAVTSALAEALAA